MTEVPHSHAMRLSVIIATRNRADTLVGQLEALCKQEWQNGWEVIVAENGSLDRTAEVVGPYRGRLPGLRMIDASRVPGPAFARNEGVRNATGDAFLFVDDDDEVGEGWLAAMGRALLEHPFVAARIDPYKLNPSWLAESRGMHQSDELQRIPYPPYFHHAAGGTLGIWRSPLEEMGGFDETLPGLEDTFFCLRLQLSGIALQFVQEATVHMRFRPTFLGMYCQAKGYGECSTLIYKKSRELGTPPIPHPVRSSLRAWGGLIKSLPALRHRRGRATWVIRLGYRVGRLKGSLKHRVLAP